MPTPSSDTSTNQVQVAAAAEADSSDTLRFRAPTLEAAIALAETSLGTRVRVVAANRIRRGGIGGFFASDLGVEVTVALDDETMEQALERIVAESTVDDRVQFESRLAQQFGAASSPVATNPANPATGNPAPQPGQPGQPGDHTRRSLGRSSFRPAQRPAQRRACRRSEPGAVGGARRLDGRGRRATDVPTRPGPGGGTGDDPRAEHGRRCRSPTRVRDATDDGPGRADHRGAVGDHCSSPCSAAIARAAESVARP